MSAPMLSRPSAAVPPAAAAAFLLPSELRPMAAESRGAAALNSSADQDMFHTLVFFIQRLWDVGDIRKGSSSASHSLSIYRDRDEYTTGNRDNPL